MSVISVAQVTLLNECVVVQVEHDTAQSMQTLLKLDAVKTRMKLASDALRVSRAH